MRRLIILSAIVLAALPSCTSTGNYSSPSSRFIPAAYNVLPTQRQPMQTTPRTTYTPPQQTVIRPGTSYNCRSPGPNGTCADAAR